MTESVPNVPVRPVAADAVDAATLLRWLRDGQEIALVDVREHGQYGEGHPFLAVSAPYSRLEIELPLLVPRRATRVVVFDDGDGMAAHAARRLRDAGYTRVHVLQGGAAAWAAAGRTLFQGQNLPSKTFGECVEHAFAVPRLSAQQLHARMAAGEPLVLLDGRTPQEHRRMTIPGAVPVPNGELALRWRSVVPDDHTPVVVHCAGRTRSIIGAQTLRDLGLPNPVYALENGTQGWALAGLELEKGSARALPPAPHSQAQAGVRKRAQSFARRTGVPQLPAHEAQAWLDDAGRTTYVFDVRTAAEFAPGSLPGPRHVPGGQLLQTTDQYVGVRHARILLLDDDGIRAPVIAAWLRRLGIETATVEGGIAAALRVPVAPVTLPPAVPEQDAGALLALSPNGSSVPMLIELRPSADYRQGHALGAHWSIRPRILATIAHATNRPIVLLADEEAVARLAAQDLREAGHARVTWLRAATLADVGWPQEATPRCPADADRIDYLFFVHDRHDGNLDAARRYLQWETGLVAHCAADELATFRLPAHARPAA